MESERKLSLAAQVRDDLFQLNIKRLEQFAFRALQKGSRPDQFIVVCIDVDDPAWTEVVDGLMPGYDWQQYRDRGEKPVARGTAHASGLRGYLGIAVPDIEVALTGPLPDGAARAVVMAEGGASVYFITPTPEP